jgi:hypothetical protein
VLQAAKLPTINIPNTRHRIFVMYLILLEALGAGCILVLIVWWTMFSGRGETEARHQAALDQAAADNAKDASPTHKAEREL